VGGAAGAGGEVGAAGVAGAGGAAGLVTATVAVVAGAAGVAGFVTATVAVVPGAAGAAWAAGGVGAVLEEVAFSELHAAKAANGSSKAESARRAAVRVDFKAAASGGTAAPYLILGHAHTSAVSRPLGRIGCYAGRDVARSG